MLLETDYDISKLTSFKIGGKVKKVYFPETVDEFTQILKTEPDALVVGNLSNILVSSKGYNGILICTKRMDEIEFDGNIVTASAGVRGTKLSKLALENHLSGLEFMVAFPGSVGGEVFMNAGAHGQMIADVLKIAKIYCPEKGQGGGRPFPAGLSGVDWRLCRGGGRRGDHQVPRPYRQSRQRPPERPCPGAAYQDQD